MAFLTKSLPRRTVLRGLGATMALPFLDAMLPPFSLCAKTVAKPVHRFQTFYVPNGMAMEYWSPKTEGSDFELTPILQPLAPFRDQMLVLSGVKANWNYIHAGASGSFLTGTTHGGRNEVEIIADVSMDQLLARRFAKETQVASLELSMDLPANAGACTGNLSCAYTHTLSWRSPTQPLPMEWNPRAVFEKLFGDSDSTERTAREARLQQHKSILDSVNEKLADLKRQLGPQDQVKVNEYTEAVRDVERRIQKAEEQRAVELPAMEQPQGAPPVFEDHLASLAVGSFNRIHTAGAVLDVHHNAIQKHKNGKRKVQVKQRLGRGELHNLALLPQPVEAARTQLRQPRLQRLGMRRVAAIHQRLPFGT